MRLGVGAPYDVGMESQIKFLDLQQKPLDVNRCMFFLEEEPEAVQCPELPMYMMYWSTPVGGKAKLCARHTAQARTALNHELIDHIRLLDA